MSAGARRPVPRPGRSGPARRAASSWRRSAVRSSRCSRLHRRPAGGRCAAPARRGRCRWRSLRRSGDGRLPRARRPDRVAAASCRRGRSPRSAAIRLGAVGPRAGPGLRRGRRSCSPRASALEARGSIAARHGPTRRTTRTLVLVASTLVSFLAFLGRRARSFRAGSRRPCRRRADRAAARAVGDEPAGPRGRRRPGRLPPRYRLAGAPGRALATRSWSATTYGGGDRDRGGRAARHGDPAAARARRMLTVVFFLWDAVPRRPARDAGAIRAGSGRRPARGARRWSSCVWNLRAAPMAAQARVDSFGGMRC